MSYSKLLLVFAMIVAGRSLAPAQIVCTGNAIFGTQECIGDAVSDKEKELFDAVNKYREANGLTPVKLSAALSRLGNRRMLDLVQNMKFLTHSWSNCRYDIADQATWPCLTESPTRLSSGYAGEGYETLYRTTKPKVEPSAALDAWKKSSLHSSIILNKGIFVDRPWEELGIAIDGQYASLWFGYRSPSDRGSVANSSANLGVSFEKAIAGLSSFLRIGLVTSVNDNNFWQGETTDKKLKLDIRGKAGAIESTEIAVFESPQIGGKIDANRQAILSAVLKNTFPEWPDVDIWLLESLKNIAQMPKAWRRKIIGARIAEIRGDGVEGIRLSIKPYVKPKAVEMD